MPRLSSKRQITIPKELCERADFHEGDSFRIVEHNGHITLIHQRENASAGLLKGFTMTPGVTEGESRDSAIAAEL